MKQILQVVVGTCFMVSTVLSVRKNGFDPITTCSLISGTGFFVLTIWSLVE